MERVGALRPERCHCCVETAKVKLCADIRFLRLSKHIASFMTKIKQLVAQRLLSVGVVLHAKLHCMGKY